MSGKLVQRSRWLAGGGGASAGLLAGPIGAIGGAIVGIIGGNRVVEKKARARLNDLVDERLADLEHLLTSNTAIELDEGPGAPTLELRVHHDPVARPGHSLALDFDVRVRQPAGAAAAAPPPIIDERVPERPTLTATRPVAMAVSVDAMNRILVGLWQAGYFDRALGQRALRQRLRQALEPTVYRVDEMHLLAPPVLVRDAERGILRLVLPRLEVELDPDEDAPGAPLRVVFGGIGAIRASEDRATEELRFWLQAPRLWNACRSVEHEVVRWSPCLSDLLALGRDRLLSVAGPSHPVASFPTARLFPVTGGGRRGHPFAVRLADLDLELSGSGGEGLRLGLDPRLELGPAALPSAPTLDAKKREKPARAGSPHEKRLGSPRVPDADPRTARRMP